MTGKVIFKTVEESQFRKWSAWPVLWPGALFLQTAASLLLTISIIIKEGFGVTPRNSGFLCPELKDNAIENRNWNKKVKG